MPHWLLTPLAIVFLTPPFAMLWLTAEPLVGMDHRWLPEGLRPYVCLLPAMSLSAALVWWRRADL
jgi:hypothetical protein